MEKNNVSNTFKDDKFITEADELISLIDEELFDIAEQIDTYKNSISEATLDKLFEKCENMVMEIIIGPFGLTKDTFNEKNGGYVTTTRNFKEGVVATSADRERYNGFEEKYDRKTYENKDFVEQRKSHMASKEPLKDALTGRDLSKDGRAHLDHMRSASEIHKDPKAHLFFTKEERVNLANDPSNLNMTYHSINQSKGDKPMKEWLDQTNKDGVSNADRYSINRNEALRLDKIARDRQRMETFKNQVKKQGSELVSTGAKIGFTLGARQFIGVFLQQFLHDSIKILRVCIHKFRKKAYITIKDFLNDLIAGLKEIGINLLSKFDDASKKFFSGVQSGFLSNFLTFLINTFITTSAKIVTIIREGGNAICRAIDILIDKNGMYDDDEKIEAASEILLAGFITCIGMSLTEIISKNLLASPLARMADAIASILVGLFVGFTTILATFLFMNMKSKLVKSQNEIMALQLQSYGVDLQMAKTAVGVVHSNINTSKSYTAASIELDDLDWNF